MKPFSYLTTSAPQFPPFKLRPRESGSVSKTIFVHKQGCCIRMNFLSQKFVSSSCKGLNGPLQDLYFYRLWWVSVATTQFCVCGAEAAISSVQWLSHVQLFATPWIAARQASLSITNSRSSLRLTSIESVMPSSHLILCHPLLLLPPIPPSIRVFSSESTLCMRWPKYWSFSFSISPSSEHPGLISFRMDWLDLLAVQGTIKSLLHHHSSKASILQHSAFFTVQLSHPYMTTGKNIALTGGTF